ncbi:MAG: class II aldolase/adducin family protein [Fibrobacteria bacterium]|nr:class II aldolase/adducin family protein [Fibrobacteria bacterium]
MNIPETLSQIGTQLSSMGLGTSTSGNISARDDEKIYYSPTGTPIGKLTPDGLAMSDLSGAFKNDNKPTKEWGMHLAVYQKFPETNAIIHVHPVHTIAVTMRTGSGTNIVLPASTPQCVMRAGLVPIAPYAPPGSSELLTGFKNHLGLKATALLNHGLFTYGLTFDKAMGILEEIEESCRIICLAGFEGRTLTQAETEILLKRKM